MFRIKITFLALLLGFLNSSSYGQSRVLSEKAQISLLTCDSGNELYSLYGHTALRVNDPVNAIDDVYNYGYFDFGTPNFYLKFIKGNLQYFAAKDRFENFYAQYVYEQRGVYEQILNLNAVQKQKIFNDLNAVLASEQKFYTYKFIDKNCTTMVANVINHNISGKISTKIKDSVSSYRTILYGYQKPYFYENLGINIMFGSKTDNQFDHPFLPLQLMESIKVSKNHNLALSGPVNVMNIKSVREKPGSFWNNWYTYILFFILILIFGRKIVYLTYFICLGLLGVFLFIVGFYSLHQELTRNINVFLFNPLLLVLAYFILKNKIKNIRSTAWICLAILLIYTILMVNKVHFLMFLPIIITNIILLAHIIKTAGKPESHHK